MSDQPILIPLQATLEGMGQVVSELENLKKLVSGIADADPSAKIKQQVLGTQTAMESLAKSLSGVFGTVGKAMENAAKQGSDAAVNTVRQSVAEVQANYEKMVALGKLTTSELGQFKVKGASLFPEDRDRLNTESLRAKSSGKVTEDDIRNLLGMPGRDEMKTFASSIKSQMLEAVAREKATDTLRARSATPFTVDDFRALNGLPSRDEGKTFAAQLKAQMLEEQAFYKSVQQEEEQKAKWKAQSATRFTIDDFRALNGLPSRDASKSFAAQLKAQMEADTAAATNTEKLRARSATPFTTDDFRSLIGLPSEERAKAMSAQIRTQMEADAANTLAGIRRSVALANASPVGAFSVSEGRGLGSVRAPQLEEAEAQRGLNEAVSAGATPTQKLREEKEKLSAEMRNAHSAARGLASGFGAMWLTWGNILPLIAGAGISASVVQMVKAGAEVNQSLTIMRVLGDESAESVARLNTQMLELAKSGPYGPIETAEAMKTLTLAGLNAQEVGLSLKDVLNFSVAGDTGIKEAADTLTTVATAFGVGAQNYSYVSDIISKAAAESKASVTDMSNSFKTASAINQQYGVSLEDTAVGLALLANAGIRGTAAGTSLRNMVADLAGRTKTSTAALKELGVEAIDPVTGKVKSLDGVMSQLMANLQKKASPEGALAYLKTIFDERGAKEAYAMFDALNKKAKDTGDDIQTVYADLKEKVTNASGFAAIAAAEMALTPLNQMKSVSATLQATLVETFDTLKPYLIETAARMRELFSSEGFKSGLQDLVIGVGTLITAVLEHGKAIATAVGAYVGLKAAAAFVMEMRLAFMSVAAAAEVAGVAVTGLGLATNLAVRTNPLLLALSAAITAAAAGWALYEMYSGRSKKAAEDIIGPQAALIKNLESERDRIVAVNEARKEGISLEEYQRRAAGKGQDDQAQNQLTRARAEVERLRKSVSDTPANPLPNGKSLASPQLQELKAAEANLDNLERTVNGQRTARIRLEYQIRAETAKGAKEERERMAKEAEENGKKFIGNSKGPADTSGQGAASAKAFAVANENVLANLKKQYETEMSVVTEQESAKAKVLSAFKSANLLTATQYYAEEILIAESAEQRKAEITAKARSDYAGQLMLQIKAIEEGLDKYKVTPSGKKGMLPDAEQIREASEKADEAIEKLRNNAASVFAQFDANDQKAKDSKFTRLTLEAIKLQGEVKKIDKDMADYLKGLEKDDLKDARKKTTSERQLFMGARELAYSQAYEAEIERMTSKNDSLNESLSTRREELDKFEEDFNSRLYHSKTEIETLERLQAEYDNYAEAVAKARKDNTTAGMKRAERAGKDGQEAYDKNLLKPVAENFRTFLSDGIRNGFLDAGKFGDLFSQSFADIMEKRLSQSIIDPIANMATKLVGDLADYAMNAMTSKAGGGSGNFIESAAAWLFSANGNAFTGSGVHAFANGGAFTNGIYSSATPFMFANGGSFKPGVMGEAGPEAVMPLARGPNGKLGVQAAGGGGGGSNLVVNIIEAPGKGGQQERRSENGVDFLDVFVEKVKSSIASDISRGSGAVPNAMASTYGLNRAAGAY